MKMILCPVCGVAVGDSVSIGQTLLKSDVKCPSCHSLVIAVPKVMVRNEDGSLCKESDLIVSFLAKPIDSLLAYEH